MRHKQARTTTTRRTARAGRADPKSCGQKISRVAQQCQAAKSSSPACGQRPARGGFVVFELTSSREPKLVETSLGTSIARSLCNCWTSERRPCSGATPSGSCAGSPSNYFGPPVPPVATPPRRTRSLEDLIGTWRDRFWERASARFPRSQRNRRWSSAAAARDDRPGRLGAYPRVVWACAPPFRAPPEAAEARGVSTL